MKVILPEKDQRITMRYTWLRDYIIVFFSLVVINGSQILIYQEIFDIEHSTENLLRPELISFWMFITFLTSLLITFIRHRFITLPIRKLGKAARRITEGDFTVRISSAKNGSEKKDYLDVLYEDFNKMAEELSSIQTLKNDFVANVSHEIKTPLAIIQNYASVLQNAPLTEEQQNSYLSTIATASENLSALVSNVLRLSKLENQQIIPLAEPYDLSEQIRHCALDFESIWDERDIEFIVDIEDGIIINCDEHMLEIVWNNLISNAVKFTEPGGAIRLTLKSRGSYAIFEISDTGCGLDETTKRHIFDKFYQGDTSHAQEGTGLGLALVMKIMQVVRGEINVESKPGHGSAFTVRLKL